MPKTPIFLASWAAALSLTGCGLAEDTAQRNASKQAHNPALAPNPQIPSETVRSPLASREDDCLLVLWEKQSAPDREFDLRFDKTDGGAISCATRTTAGEFAKAITDIRAAAAARDRRAMLDQIGLPLLYIDADGESRRLADRGAVDVLFDRIFDAEVYTALQQIDLQDIAVTPGQGGDFQLGSIWLAVAEDGGRPRIVTVNQQALNEAMSAAAVAPVPRLSAAATSPQPDAPAI